MGIGRNYAAKMMIMMMNPAFSHPLERMPYARTFSFSIWPDLQRQLTGASRC